MENEEQIRSCNAALDEVQTPSLSICQNKKSDEDSSIKTQNQEKEVCLEGILHSPCFTLECQSRIRKKKRPYSPELITKHSQRTAGRVKFKRKDLFSVANVEMSEKKEIEEFSCDRCHASYIVNPARCRLSPMERKKTPSKRKKFDPTSNKILSLCNACGIALSRSPKLHKKTILSIDDRDKYLMEAASFANAIADRVHNPIAKRLFCPSFKNKPCGCIQTYLSHQGEGEQDTLESRVERLLELLKTANQLGRRKNIFPNDDASSSQTFNVLDQKRNCENTATPSERRQQHQDYEQFVLETRQQLKDKFRLCERACQRLLLYSNNFLHKKLKSEQCSRISRQTGRNVTNQLKPIDELSLISCCSDNCSRIARTHSTLLEEWRRQAAQGQKQARRVLAEMLTPSGGTKANCYKFISMVTGCGSSTISSVSHQMRVTKGDREPPEHGLKKWYRDNPRKKLENTLSSSSSTNPNPTVFASASHHIPGIEDANFVSEPSSKLELERQRQQLEEAKHQLLLKQQELDHCQQIIDQHIQQTLSSSNGNLSNMWRVNVLKTGLKHNDVSSSTTSVTIQEESDLNIISSGDSVQLLDLIPGTYIAVPTDFNTSSFLTVTTDHKFPTTHDNTVSVDPHAPLSAELLHPITPPSKRTPASDLRVQTILDIHTGNESMNRILAHSSTNPQLGIQYVTIPSSECSAGDCLPVGISEQCTSSSTQMQPLSSLEGTNNGEPTSICSNSGSPCVSVITATGEVQPLKPVAQLSSALSTVHHDTDELSAAECSTSQNSGCEAQTLSNVMILSKSSGSHMSHSLEFEKFFR